MYKIEKLNELAKVVAAKRAENAALEPRRMTAEEKDDLLSHFHPDYKQDEFTVLSAGVNKGDKVFFIKNGKIPPFKQIIHCQCRM